MNPAHTMPYTLEPIEYSDDAIVRKVRGNGRVTYKGHEYLVGEAFAGNQVELKLNLLGEEIRIYFDQFKIYTYNLNLEKFISICVRYVHGFTVQPLSDPYKN